MRDLCALSMIVSVVFGNTGGFPTLFFLPFLIFGNDSHISITFTMYDKFVIVLLADICVFTLKFYTTSKFTISRHLLKHNSIWILVLSYTWCDDINWMWKMSLKLYNTKTYYVLYTYIVYSLWHSFTPIINICFDFAKIEFLLIETEIEKNVEPNGFNFNYHIPFFYRIYRGVKMNKK